MDSVSVISGWNGGTIVPVKDVAGAVDLTKRLLSARYQIGSLHPKVTDDRLRWRMNRGTWHVLAEALEPPTLEVGSDGAVRILGVRVERVNEMRYGELEWVVVI